MSRLLTKLSLPSNIVYGFYFGFVFLYLNIFAGKTDLEGTLTSIYSLGLKSQWLPGDVVHDSFMQRVLAIPIYDPGLVLGTELPLHEFMNQLTGPFFLLGLSDKIFQLSAIYLCGFTIGYLLYDFKLNFTTNKSKLMLVISPFAGYIPLYLYLNINDWFLGVGIYINLFLLSFNFLRIERVNQWKIHDWKKTNNIFIGILIILPYGHLSNITLLLVLVLLHLTLFPKQWLKYVKSIRLGLLQKVFLLVGIINMLSVLYFVKQYNPKNNEPPRHVDPLNIVGSFGNGRNLLIYTLIVFVSIFLLEQHRLLDTVKRLLMVVGILILFTNKDIATKISTSGGFYARDFLWAYSSIFLFGLVCKQNVSLLKIEKKHRNLFANAVFAIFSFHTIFVTVSIFNLMNASFVNLPKPHFAKPMESEFSTMLNTSFIQKGMRVLTLKDDILRTPNMLGGVQTNLELSNAGVGLLNGWTKVRDQSHLKVSVKRYESQAYLDHCEPNIVKFLMPSLLAIDKEKIALCKDLLSDSDFVSIYPNNYDSKFVWMKPKNIKIYLLSEEFLSGWLDLLEKCPLYSNLCKNKWTTFFQSRDWKKGNLDQEIRLCKMGPLSGFCFKKEIGELEGEFLIPISFHNRLRILDQENSSEGFNAGGFLASRLVGGDIFIYFSPSFRNYIFAGTGWLLYALILFVFVRAINAKVHSRSKV